MKSYTIQKISAVLPVYNEESSLPPLYTELTAILSREKKPYEIIFVDDASTDQSLEKLERIFTKDRHVQVISLLGNQGQTAALNAGFKHASGDVVIAMDSDGQHNPSYIPEFIRAIGEGYDMASSWKKEDTGRSRTYTHLSRFAHGIIRKIVGINLNYFGATMKAYRMDILRHLDLSGDLHRFAGALVYYKGIRIKEIPIAIRPREKGTTKYQFGKIFKVLLDLILIKFLTAYAKTPFRMFGTMGVMLAGLGTLGILYVAFQKFVYHISAFPNTALIVISALGIILGVQFIIFGLIAEMISRVYHTTNNKELYRIKSYLKH